MTKYAEPKVPAGYRAGKWVRWSDVARLQRVIGPVRATMNRAVRNGTAQWWKKGPHDSSPMFFRSLKRKA